MTSRTGDLDADADSLMCRQPGLTYNDDRPKMGSKQPRTGLAEPFGQALKMIKLVGIGMMTTTMMMMMMMTEKLAWISRHLFQSLETLVTSLRTMLCLSESHQELQSH